ncbi:MAG: hypothetical protein GY745_00970 [Actinomycetia bacterium]|nr:hypothetical protein [Actinomycetes bacterium]
MVLDVQEVLTPQGVVGSIGALPAVRRLPRIVEAMAGFGARFAYADEVLVEIAGYHTARITELRDANVVGGVLPTIRTR